MTRWSESHDNSHGFSRSIGYPLTTYQQNSSRVDSRLAIQFDSTDSASIAGEFLRGPISPLQLSPQARHATMRLRVPIGVHDVVKPDQSGA